MSIATNRVGIESTDAKDINNHLNDLLSSYHIYYINVRGYHWNIKGEHFFSLHEKFEELYTALQVQIDEIAERILTLGGTPLHAYSDFAQHSKIEEDKNVFKDTECVRGLLNGLKQLIDSQREVIESADVAGDDGTADLLTAYVQEQEKLMWMYSAFLNNQ